jgi:elongation factor 2
MYVYIDDATLHEDAIHRGPAQVLPAINRGLFCAMLQASPVMYEPKQKLYISFPNEYLGAMTKELQNRRARLEDIKTQGEETIITGIAPVKELIGFSQASRSVTQGKAIWTAEYAGYEALPREMQTRVVSEIRTRKGMEPQPKDASYYAD